MAYVLGLDISTTGAKALVIDERGSVIASHTTPQSISQPKSLWSEQNPAEWWQGIGLSVRTALADANLTGDDIAGVGLTGQMHGLVILDDANHILRPAILWNDQRTQDQCDEITETIGLERLIQLTGNRALTGFTAPKILWVHDNEPEIYAQIKHILLPKDYIRLCLTGEYATDLAGAAGTSLLNVRDRTWSSEMLNALKIPAEWLPPVHEGTQITGRIHQAGAEFTGLNKGTPVVGGGGDQAAGAVGVGAVERHIIAVSLGTSGVVFAPLDYYAYEPQGRLHAFCHAVPGMWHFMGVMLSAAGSLQWYSDILSPGVAFDDLLTPAQDIPPGSDGLLFLPYLTGERTPHPDVNARGAFIGLTTRHTKAHLTRAVLEGVAFGLKDSFELISQAGLPEDIEVRIAGGGAKSPVWRQIIADILGARLVSTSITEGSAYGAALLAAVGIGIFPDVTTACQETITTSNETLPGKNQEMYHSAYSNYCELYPALKHIFPWL